MRKIWFYVIILSLSCLKSGSVGAAGLRTTFVEVKLDNLKIGHTYNVTELINLPLVVENTGDEKANLKIDVLLPNRNELREGYDPIPDSSWIKFSQDVFEVEVKGMAATDVIISIPDDERYLGKRYQAWIWSHTVGPGMIGVGLKSRILFSIAEVTEETGQNGIGILPTEIYVTDVDVGKVFDVKQKSNGVTLKVFNRSEGEKKIKIESIGIKNSPFEPKEGYIDCLNPSFLILSDRVFTLPKDGEKEIEMYIAFPKKERYRGKKYMFVVHVMVVDQPNIETYSKVYVSLK